MLIFRFHMWFEDVTSFDGTILLDSSDEEELSTIPIFDAFFTGRVRWNFDNDWIYLRSDYATRQQRSISYLPFLGLRQWKRKQLLNFWRLIYDSDIFQE